MNVIVKNNFSTIRLLTKKQPTFTKRAEDTFESMLFLPPNGTRKEEGGLRTQGYFKKSYEDKPLVTVITVVYNGEAYLEETILSVINQTYDNVEYIIVDGGSTDGTLEIIKKYDKQIDYWVSEQDSGIYNAWNKAITVAAGKWIAFLGADDLYLKNAIELYINYIGNKDIDYCSSQVELITKEKRLIEIFGLPWQWRFFKKNMKVAHVGSLHNINYFKKMGLYNTNYQIAADYEMLLRKRNKLQALFLNSITVKMRDGGISNSMINLVFKETMNAKINTAKRNKLIVYYEYYLAHIKYYIKRWVYFR